MTLTRRAVLAVLGSLGLAACSADVPEAAPGTPPPRRVAYGPDPAQYGELHLPPESAGGARVPVVVIVHGGYWQQAYGLDLGTPLAVDLTNAGVAAWNVEYRRIGGGGGYPATFVDVAAAIDALAGPAADPRVDPARTALLGHSAGGQLAVWAVSRRPGGPAGAATVRPRGVVAQAGVLDLAAAARQGLGGGAVVELLGGDPASVPDRYAAASPVALVPPPVPVVCVHGDDDTTVPPDQSARYVAAAGGAARLETIDGADHFALIDPTTTAWAACRREVLALAGS